MIVAVLSLATVGLIVTTSVRLRSEIAALFEAFNRTEQTLAPLVVQVHTDRDRLAERLATLSDPGSGTDARRR